MLRMTIGEMMDRYTIEARKEIYGAAGASEINKAIDKELRKHITPEAAVLIQSAIALAVLNCSIAEIEWQVREGKDLPLEEIGRRALAIRELNSKRVKVKNDLSRCFGDPESPVYYGKGALKAANLTLEIQDPRLNV